MGVKRSHGMASGLGSRTLVVGGMKKTSLQTTTVSTLTKVVWESELYDTEGTIVDLANNKLIVPFDGLYEVGGMLYITNGAAAYQAIQLYVNGSAAEWIFRGATQTTSEYRPWSLARTLSADDYLEVYYTLPTGSYYNYRDESTFWLHLIGFV